MNSICFITTSDDFTPLIQKFRSGSISAFKKNYNANLDEYEVLIIDLGYPKDLAYTLLSNIKKNSFYSDKIVLAVISDKSQLRKLRSIALGCDGYISPAISYNDLLDKINSLREPQKYLIRKKIDNKKIDIHFDGILTHISETGCLISSKVSLSSESTDLKIHSQLFQDLKLSDQLNFVPRKSNPTAKRSFISEIRFVSINEEDRQSIRKTMLSWSTL